MHPSTDILNQWLNELRTQIDEYEAELVDGDVEFKQSAYGNLAQSFAKKGRLLYLHDVNPTEIHQAYQEAANMMEKNFIMAYDQSSPDYIGDTDSIHWGWVDYNAAIDMIVWSLMGGDFDQTKRVAKWMDDPTAKDTYDEEYEELMQDAGWLVETLREVIINQDENRNESVLELASNIRNQFRKIPDNRHYYAMGQVIIGIINRDELLIAQGLNLQLHYYTQYIERQKNKDDTCYLCEDAVAFANLALHNDLVVRVQSLYLPSSLLIN